MFIIKKKITAGWIINTVLLFFIYTPCSAQILQRFEYEEGHMGTSFNIIFYTDDQNFADSIAGLAFTRVAELNQIMSDYLPNSEVNHLCSNYKKSKAQSISKDLFYVLKKAKKWSKKTDGHFDVTIGPLTKIWRKAFRQQEFPDSILITNALKRVDYNQLKISWFSQKIKLKKQDIRIDLGGIAKGYAVDEVMKLLKNNGIKSALVDGGGDILVSAPPPDKHGWKIQLITKKGFLILSNQAIATSGATHKYLEWKNNRYSHIINPKTGYGVIDQKPVTVLAKSCLEADLLSSTLSIISEKKIKGSKKYWKVL